MYPDDEDPADEFDYEDDLENEELSCPSCGRAVYEDAERCPHCGDWIMPLAGHAARPTWTRVVGAVVVIAMLLGLVGLIRLFF